MPMSWSVSIPRSSATTSSATFWAAPGPSEAAAQLARQHAAQDVDQRPRLVALHRVTRVLHDLNSLELLCTPRQFVCILVGDEGRRPAAHQPDRHRQAREVVPQAVEVGNLSDVVVTPGPGAVVQATGVVKDAAPQ